MQQLINAFFPKSNVEPFEEKRIKFDDIDVVVYSNPAPYKDKELSHESTAKKVATYYIKFHYGIVQSYETPENLELMISRSPLHSSR